MKKANLEKEALLNEQKEKNWDNRFTNLKITEYDSFKDVNLLSLGLIKAKIKFENNEKILKRAASKRDATYRMNANIGNKDCNYFSPSKQNIYANINFNNLLSINNKNKYGYMDTFPNSCRKQKNITNSPTVSSSDRKTNKNSPKEKENPDLSSPLYRYKNYSFRERKQNFQNILINDLIIKIQLDKDLNKLYKNVEELWDNYGVTRAYRNNFLASLNESFKSKKLLLEFLYIEQNSILKFKNEFELIINRIEKRKGEIDNLKKLIKEYENNKNLDKDVENDVNNIKNSLKLIRLYTINLVSQIKKFYLVNSHLTSSGKIEFNKIKVNKYNFDYNYFSKIKEDLYFLKDSFINNNLFNFNEIENDLFLLTISDILEFNKIKKENPNCEILPISDEMYRQVLKLTYFLNQMKIYEKMNNKNDVKEFPKKSDNNSFINTNNIYNNYLNSWHTLNNEINLGVNYRGNINKIINQLKNKNNYDEIFLKSIPNIESYNQKKNNEKKSSPKPYIKEQINITTAEELQKKFKEYEKIKQLIEHDNHKNSSQ